MSDLEQRLRLRLALEIPAALKSRQIARTAALRSLLAAIDNAQAVPLATLPARSPLSDPIGEVQRRMLSDEELAALFAREIDERRAAAVMLENHGRREEAEQLRAELEVLAGYSAEFRGIAPSHGG